MTELCILFADIAESTALFEKHGDEAAREAISSVLEVLLSEAEKHQGQLVKTIGDEIMCTFPKANHALLAAVDMQNAVSGNFVLGNHPITIRVGFHYGDVIEEDGDVFGDAVNVAARMTGYAKKGQIITNSITFKTCLIPPFLTHRSLGKAKIKGKLLPVEIIEVLWQQDTSQVTRVTSALDIKIPTTKSQLKLELNAQQQIMTDQSPTKTIGRGDDCDLQVSMLMASRHHGEIQYASGHFKYTDESTNGTWILQNGNDPIRIHRDSMLLQGEGQITFGEPDFSNLEQLLQFKILK
ncbi:adenylate/guanylate cyclase domain-containing protein [Marinicella sp. S1101]|uniref:adenylate/guanylate cyclase domain-containing protein n=1 Tax=Marinicella marina TaxID=2996016 RepID=UPI002260CCC3|nr:adenylate/guanylate cyclase domain-containing protein [Marinicella marina]MCX7554152.1 adenylate/guanylate cyclase domain-containing protein [Marinicella marina]MDJ1141155.1 adenylate/guanylate cyclase domain-containing protein [Marinicella marina]